MNLQLRAVTRDNFDEVVDLNLLEHQEAFVASNSYSLAQASFCPEMRTRAIYLDETVIGFFLYVTPVPDREADTYAIFRVMIGADYQGKGYGRRAFALLLDEIRAHADARRITISYKPANTVAQALYASFGFREIGIDEEDGEMVAELRLPRD